MDLSRRKAVLREMRVSPITGLRPEPVQMDTGQTGGGAALTGIPQETGHLGQGPPGPIQIRIERGPDQSLQGASNKPLELDKLPPCQGLHLLDQVGKVQ
jgi:hypothetical protein